MDLHAQHELHCTPADLTPLVADLERYPDWLSIVPRVERAEAAADDPGEAWWVTLRGRLGPVSRSKRLRMTAVGRGDGHVRFERRELDGRRHSAWTLDARWRAFGDRTLLEMHLHYGGRLFDQLVQRLLEGEIAASKLRLNALVASPD